MPKIAMDARDTEHLREEGFCIFPEVLSRAELDQARTALARGLALAEERAGTAHDARLDPNASNLRVYNLPAVDPVFIELLRREDAIGAARAVLGRHHPMISNFTANVALPGSLSMKLHSDQALVIPPPWEEPWAVNVIWCLDDVDEESGATRYLPGSHRFRRMEDVPADAMERTRAFSAPAGSFIVMEGRVWHTSGANVSKDRQRRMLFAYYSADFIRPQMNWNAALPASVQDSLDEETRGLFGLGPMGNVRVGGGMTRQ
jgi:ectoine hydroxylase-related dioxygenase (phytanoyl-CoA dioxygenase family)